MSKNDETRDSVVRVEVDVTKIVKYVCLTGVFIVGIIFGSSALSKAIEKTMGERQE